MGGIKLILFDWGDTVMRDFREYDGPMHLWPQVDVLPGVKNALSVLSRDHTLALATNAAESCEEEIWMALGRVSLDILIDKVYCFRKVGFRKPAREFFDHILKDLGLMPCDAVMVGDDFESDILGANGSGIFAIWLNLMTSERRVSRMYDTIYTIADLPGLINRRKSVPQST
jgi:FMN phosphatase YigB (HAD superfamily)